MAAPFVAWEPMELCTERYHNPDWGKSRVARAKVSSAAWKSSGNTHMKMSRMAMFAYFKRLI